MFEYNIIHMRKDEDDYQSMSKAYNCEYQIYVYCKEVGIYIFAIQ